MEYKAIENYISPSSYDLNVVKRETINLFNDAKDGYITTYRIDSIIDNVNDNIEDGFELYGYEYDGNIVSKDDIANNNLLITVDGNNKEVILYIYKDVEITYTATKTSEEHLGDGSKTKTFVYPVGYDLKVLTPSGEILVENLIPVKPNYIHIGWKMTNNGVTGTTIYANNSRITLNNLSPVTMTAEYKQPDIGTTSIKVRFLPHSGSPDYIEEIYGNGETIRLKSLEELYAYDIAQGTNAKIWTNSRQIVVSWDLVDAVYGSTTFGTGDNYTVPITIDANAIIEFIANWENTYNIKFQAPVPNAENMPETIRVINGQMVYVKDISTPTPPASASNNEFKNWYYNNGVENVKLTNKDIIVVGFNATEYTISYRNDGYHIHTFPANMGNITDFIINSDWGRSKINITMRFYDESIDESTTSDEYDIYIDDTF